jgi:hypothetical protein
VTASGSRGRDQEERDLNAPAVQWIDHQMA